MEMIKEDRRSLNFVWDKKIIDTYDVFHDAKKINK